MTEVLTFNWTVFFLFVTGGIIKSCSVSEGRHTRLIHTGTSGLVKHIIKKICRLFILSRNIVLILYFSRPDESPSSSLHHKVMV